MVRSALQRNATRKFVPLSAPQRTPSAAPHRARRRQAGVVLAQSCRQAVLLRLPEASVVAALERSRVQAAPVLGPALGIAARTAFAGEAAEGALDVVHQCSIAHAQLLGVAVAARGAGQALSARIAGVALLPDAAVPVVATLYAGRAITQTAWRAARARLAAANLLRGRTRGGSAGVRSAPLVAGTRLADGSAAISAVYTDSATALAIFRSEDTLPVGVAAFTHARARLGAGWSSFGRVEVPYPRRACTSAAVAHGALVEALQIQRRLTSHAADANRGPEPRSPRALR